MLAARVANHHLQLAFKVLEVQYPLHTMQGVIGMGHGNEFDGAQFCAQVARNIETADGQVGHAFQQNLFDARQDFFAQPHTTATALRHKSGQGAHQSCIRVGGVNHQPHFGFPALFHVVGEVFKLAGLFDQLARAP